MEITSADLGVASPDIAQVTRIAHHRLVFHALVILADVVGTGVTIITFPGTIAPAWVILTPEALVLLWICYAVYTGPVALFAMATGVVRIVATIRGTGIVVIAVLTPFALYTPRHPVRALEPVPAQFVLGLINAHALGTLGLGLVHGTTHTIRFAHHGHIPALVIWPADIAGAGVAIIAIPFVQAAAINLLRHATLPLLAEVSRALVVVIAPDLALPTAEKRLAHRHGAHEPVFRAQAVHADMLAGTVGITEILGAGDAIVAVLGGFNALAADAPHIDTGRRRNALREPVATLHLLVNAPDAHDALIHGGQVTIVAEHREELAPDSGDTLSFHALVAQPDARARVGVAEVATRLRAALIGRAWILVVAGECLVQASGLQVTLIHGAGVAIIAGDIVGGVVALAPAALLHGAHQAVVRALGVIVTLRLLRLLLRLLLHLDRDLLRGLLVNGRVVVGLPAAVVLASKPETQHQSHEREEIPPHNNPP